MKDSKSVAQSTDAAFGSVPGGEAVENNLFASSMLLGHVPGAEINEDSGVIRIYTGLRSSSFNGILIRAQGLLSITAVARAANYLRDRDTPASCILRHERINEELLAYLNSCGFRFSVETAGMVLHIGAKSDSKKKKADYTISEIRRADEVNSWLEPVVEVFGFQDAELQAFRSATLGLVGRAPGLRLLLARDGSHVVGSASVFCQTGIFGLYNVATRPDRRQRGIGSMLVRAGFDIAETESSTVAVVHALLPSTGFWERFGFQKTGRLCTYRNLM